MATGNWDWDEQWEGNPTNEDIGWGADIIDILDDWWETSPPEDVTIGYQWRVFAPSGASMTFYAPEKAIEDVRLYTDVHRAEIQEYHDNDLMQFDMPREPYESRSNPPPRAPRPIDPEFPQQPPHRIDVRPRRRGPRIPREPRL